ncbi:TIGR02300 family protein [Parvibaculum sedimenti]|uniref:TIGR02300 family protein n=1 Tax=Parvibaculum sedimenti TaxID=2608632 RepID=A0A6N6VM93_9HYPH|nr:TIGR02300 family protein [Parvibaculum sedimenti]KAB7742709.1 TIGR02300 family protein [Parvibaculum sedimenti]
MSKPELGTKRDCPSCGAKFYDLNKSPAVCPKCKHEFVPDSGAKAKRVKPVEKPKEKAPRPVVVADDEDNVSLDAMRDEELAAEDLGDDILEDIGEEIEDDAEDDAFLPDDEDEEDDVSGIIRGVGEDDE